MVEATKTCNSDIEPVYSWFWQSDPNPWKETNEAKWTWTAYPDNICTRIEEAVFSKQLIVNLGNYEMDLTKMLQISKVDRNKIRRVKRELQHGTESRFLIEPELPKPIQQDEKTINQAFGHIKHFLNYMMKRTPAAFKLYEKLQGLNLDTEKSQYTDIIEEVICSIIKAAEQREKIIKNRILYPSQNSILEAEKIVREIKSANLRRLRDFLKLILKLYTMETYLCYYLNELLRNEKWEELNVLTPYLVCLAYAFQIQDYVVQLPQEDKTNYFKKLFKKRRLALYRGATITEEHLEFYRKMKGKHFSWNAVTSTSRRKDVAMEFLKLSLEKAKQHNEKKVGVVFRIKTDFETSQDCEGMIDVSGYSKFPQEQEVILAPGTVFEFATIECNQDNIYEIKLQIKKKFNKIVNQIPLLGTLQSKVIQGHQAIFDNLNREEFIKALQLLQGNKLVTRLEITNCVLDDHLIRLIEDTRVTTNMRHPNIILTNNKIDISNLQVLFKDWSLDIMIAYVVMNNQIVLSQAEQITQGLKVKKGKLLFIQEMLKKLSIANPLEDFFRRMNCEFEVEELILSLDYKHFEFMKSITAAMTGLKKLCIKVPYLYTDNWNLQDNAFCKMIGNIGLMTNLHSLSLEISTCFDGENDGERSFDSLKNVLKTLNSLRHFSLRSKNSSDNELNHLKDGLKMLTSLQHLSLDFDQTRITDNGLNHLKDGLKMLTSLQHLSLTFDWAKQISDNGLNHLKDALKMLNSLEHFSLRITACNISKNGCDYLKEALKKLPFLKYLSLDCYHLPSSTIESLKDGLKMLTSLQHLTLPQPSLSDDSLNHLKDALNVLNSLQHLSLDFWDNSDGGLNHLKDALKMLSSLQHLSLRFGSMEKITDNGLNHLKDGLIMLTSLRHLSLGFGESKQITDNGLNHLKDGLKMLTSLQHLSLKFDWIKQISDNSLNQLKDALRMLTSLQHLSLEFDCNNQISDNGLDHLKDALKMLTSLQYLSLSFCGCEQITDNGLNHLKDALKMLTSLQHLSLEFDCNNQISDNGLDHLKDALKMLNPLQTLSLIFGNCKQISDNGLNHLKEALKMLTSLQNLSLHLKICPGISDNGLNHLKDALKMLNPLQNLSLSFRGCERISYDGLNYLKDAFKMHTYLQHLSLNIQGCKIWHDDLTKFEENIRNSLTPLQNFDFSQEDTKPLFSFV